MNDIYTLNRILSLMIEMNIKDYLRSIYKRRYFIYYSAYFNLKSRHLNTFLGQFWILINPILLAIIYYVLTTLLNSKYANDIDHFLSILSGIFIYYYTKNCIQYMSTSITNNASIIIDSPFPKIILPLSYMMLSVFVFIPTVIIYAAIHAIYYHTFYHQLLLIPLFLIIQTLFNVGFGLIMAVSTLFLKDLELLLPFLLRIWVYISPIMYSEDKIYSSHNILAIVCKLNPLTYIIGGINNILQYKSKDFMIYTDLSISSTIAISTLLLGIYLFIKNEDKFIYYL